MLVRVYRVTGYSCRYVLKNEADDSLRLLEWLNQPIQQNAVETTIVPMYVVSVVLVEGVHDRPPLQCQDRDRSSYLWSSTMAPPLHPVIILSILLPLRCRGYQGRSPWLVSALQSPGNEAVPSARRPHVESRR